MTVCCHSEVLLLCCCYDVLCLQDFLAMVMGWDNDAVWMRWRPEEGTRLHLVTLDGSKVCATNWWECVQRLCAICCGGGALWQ